MKLQFSLALLGLLTACVWAQSEERLHFNDVNKELTVKLLQNLVEDDNALFSPILLSNSLLLLTNSVSGAAKDELLKFLKLKNAEDLDHVNQDAKTVWQHRSHLLSNKARVSTDKTLFDLLPKLVVQTDKDLEAKFTELAKDNYPTDIYKMAALSSENQRGETKKINEWFSEKSSTGQLARMLDDNELTSDIKLLSLNGAGFKGAWKGEPFSKNNTKEDDFNNADGKASKIFYLCAEEKPFRVVKDDTEKLLTVELPFTEHDDADGHKHKANLVVLLPLDDNTVDKIIDNLNKEKLDKILDTVSKADRKKPEQLKFPKLVNFEKEYELKDALVELSVKGIFDQSVANFSDMIQGADASSPKLQLSQLDHKAVVQWTEEGDNAADTEPVPADKDAVIAINKPFLFFVTDEPVRKSTTKRDADHEAQHKETIIVFAGRIKTLTRDSTYSIDLS